MLSFDETPGGITVTNGFWRCTHFSGRGGAIGEIVFPYGRNRNILVAPLSATAREFIDDRPQHPCFRDSGDRNARIELLSVDPDRIILCTTAGLYDENGVYGGIDAITEYEYRSNRIGVRRLLRFTDRAVPVNRVTPICAELTDELDHWTVRRSPISELGEQTAHQFQTMVGSNGPNYWGNIESCNVAYREWHVSGQLALYRKKGEALEIVPGGELRQWNYQFENVPDACSYSYIKRFFAPRRHVMGIDAYFGMFRPAPVKFSGDYEFTFYLGLPNLRPEGPTRRAVFVDHPLRIREGFRWATEDEIRTLAEDGVQLLVHHHDGPGGYGLWPDGSFFWPDGVCPPYDRTERENLRRTIGLIHRYGMKVIPYFNVFEIHPSAPAFAGHEDEWARIFRGRKYLNHTVGGVFGLSVCLHSGFAGFLRGYIEQVLREFDFDGVYFDGVHPFYCEHGGTAHYTVTEMLELMEWTRRLIGDEKYLVIHQTGAPWIAAENLSDLSVIMENVCGFPNFEACIPDLDSFDPAVEYSDHICHAVCPYAVLGNHPDYETQSRLLIARCLLRGVTFYPTSRLKTAESPELSNIKRFSRQMKSFDPDRTQFRILDPAGISAYRCGDEAVIVSATPDAPSAAVAAGLGWPGLTVTASDPGRLAGDYSLFRVKAKKGIEK